MPIELKTTRGDHCGKQIVDEFRHKIADGQGFSTQEVSELTGISIAQVRRVFSQNHWAVKRFSPELKNAIWLLVNPRDLKKYADKS